MRKTVLIVEDDTEQLHMLEKLVLGVNENTEVCTADNVTVAYRLLMEKTVDVFLVDIVLDTASPADTSGVRLVERIRQVPKYMFTPVIFVTSMEDPEMYAYRGLNCTGYIEKPYDPVQVRKLVERALNYTTAREKDTTLMFRKDGILYPVNLKEIVYMESLNHVMNIRLSNGTVLDIPYKTCRCVLREEDTSGTLLQCGRGVLVNREYVKGIDTANRYLMLKDGHGMVGMGGRYKKSILAEFGEKW